MSNPIPNPGFFTQQLGDDIMPQDDNSVPTDPGNQDPPLVSDPDLNWSQDAPTVLRAVASLGQSVNLFTDQHKAMVSALYEGFYWTLKRPACFLTYNTSDSSPKEINVIDRT